MLDTFGNPISENPAPEAETPAEVPAAPLTETPAETPAPFPAAAPRLIVLGGQGVTAADLALLFPDAALRAQVTADLTASGALRDGPGSRTCLDC